MIAMASFTKNLIFLFSTIIYTEILVINREIVKFYNQAIHINNIHTNKSINEYLCFLVIVNTAAINTVVQLSL